MEKKKLENRAVIPAFAGMTALILIFSSAIFAAPGTKPAGKAAGAAGGPMDVTIKGQSKDKVEIERVKPVPNVLIKDVIPFSRLGQTDWVLTEELGYLDEEK